MTTTGPTMDMDRFRALTPARQADVTAWVTANGLHNAIRIQPLGYGQYRVQSYGGTQGYEFAIDVVELEFPAPPPWLDPDWDDAAS